MSGTIVLDVDGVLLLGSEPIEGSAAALPRLAAAGFRLIVATNNATRSPQQAADRIERSLGYRFEPGCVVTSTVAVAMMLGAGDQPVLAAAEEGMAITLREHGIEVTGDARNANTVVVGLDRSFTYDKLTAAADAVRGGARFVASNRDFTFPIRGGAAPGAGALVAAIEAASGVTAEVAGKPHEPMRRAVTRCLADGPVWMVGDRPETDIAFGAAAGWTTVLTLSGVIADPAAVPEGLTPDLVVGSLADLPDVLA